MRLRLAQIARQFARQGHHRNRIRSGFRQAEQGRLLGAFANASAGIEHDIDLVALIGSGERRKLHRQLGSHSGDEQGFASRGFDRRNNFAIQERIAGGAVMSGQRAESLSNLWKHFRGASVFALNAGDDGGDFENLRQPGETVNSCFEAGKRIGSRELDDAMKYSLSFCVTGSCVMVS